MWRRPSTCIQIRSNVGCRTSASTHRSYLTRNGLTPFHAEPGHDQLFNHRENRLARVLLKLSRYGQHDFLPDAKLSQLSPETLADLVGTTRSRISHFLNKFRRLGLIHSNGNGEIMVRAEMLADMVLRVGDTRPR